MGLSSFSCQGEALVSKGTKHLQAGINMCALTHSVGSNSLRPHGGADTQRMVKGGHRLSRDSNTFWKKTVNRGKTGEGEGRGERGRGWGAPCAGSSTPLLGGSAGKPPSPSQSNNLIFRCAIKGEKFKVSHSSSGRPRPGMAVRPPQPHFKSRNGEGVGGL